jgi:serine/threonine protein kinase
VTHPLLANHTPTRRLCPCIPQGLDYLHYNKVVHGDLKPSNLLRDSNSGKVKIADFGSSIMAGGDKVFSMRNSPGFSTPAFRSPESLTSGYQPSFEVRGGTQISTRTNSRSSGSMLEAAGTACNHRQPQQKEQLQFWWIQQGGGAGDASGPQHSDVLACTTLTLFACTTLPLPLPLPLLPPDGHVGAGRVHLHVGVRPPALHRRGALCGV